MGDPFHLQRFLSAQGEGIDGVLQELRAGRKRRHWMWYVFPQLVGLGHSATAEHYAIRSREEAAALLAHPLLGSRLRQCTEAVNAHPDRSAEAIFGHPDVLKFRSSMTLFATIAGEASPFFEALALFYDGVPDPRTLEILQTL